MGRNHISVKKAYGAEKRDAQYPYDTNGMLLQFLPIHDRKQKRIQKEELQQKAYHQI